MKKNKESISGVSVIVIAIIIVGAILFTALRPEKEEMISVPYATSDINMVGFQSSFIEGCAEEGGDIVECSCYYEELYKAYGAKGILNLSADYLKTEQLPAKAFEVVSKCI